MKHCVSFNVRPRRCAGASLPALWFAAQALRRPTRCPRGTTAPPRRRSSSSCRTTTTQGSPKFVPPAERIATFDQDGTLWVEHPMYSQVMYVLESVPALVKAKPELAKVAPFSTVLEI